MFQTQNAALRLLRLAKSPSSLPWIRFFYLKVYPEKYSKSEEKKRLTVLILYSNTLKCLACK